MLNRLTGTGGISDWGEVVTRVTVGEPAVGINFFQGETKLVFPIGWFMVWVVIRALWRGRYKLQLGFKEVVPT